MVNKETLMAIGRPGKTCANCDAPIVDVERHPSGVRGLSDSRPERYDYCPDCWQHLKSETWESFWLTKRRITRRVRKLNRRERAAALRALFESLWERRDTDEQLGPRLFFLAHLLMKWGGLKWIDSRTADDGVEVVLFEDPASGDVLDIRSYAADDPTIEDVKDEVEAFLREYASEDEEVEL